MFGFLKKNEPAAYAGSAEMTGFIVGTGRCGTTILAQVLNSHSRICVPHELQFLVSVDNGDRLYDKFLSGELARYDAGDLLKLLEVNCPYLLGEFFDFRGHFESLKYPQRDPAVIARELFDHICHSYGKDIFLEQTPWYGQRLDTLRTFLPEMKVVHICRDGRDVAISFARTPWWSDNLLENIKRWEEEVNTIEDFGRRYPNSYIVIRYEDLILNPEAEIKRVLAHLGAGFEPSMLDPENLIDYMSMFRGEIPGYKSKTFSSWEGDKKDVFFKGSIGAWKKRTDIDIKALTEEAAGTLERFGYET